MKSETLKINLRFHSNHSPSSQVT